MRLEEMTKEELITFILSYDEYIKSFDEDFQDLDRTPVCVSEYLDNDFELEMYETFTERLEDSTHLDDKDFLEYLKDNARLFLASSYIDDMSCDFSNKYDLYEGSFEGLLGDLMENGVNKAYNRLLLD